MACAVGDTLLEGGVSCAFAGGKGRSGEAT